MAKIRRDPITAKSRALCEPIDAAAANAPRLVAGRSPDPKPRTKLKRSTAQLKACRLALDDIAEANVPWLVVNVAPRLRRKPRIAPEDIEITVTARHHGVCTSGTARLEGSSWVLRKRNGRRVGSRRITDIKRMLCVNSNYLLLEQYFGAEVASGVLRRPENLECLAEAMICEGLIDDGDQKTNSGGFAQK